MALSPPDTVSIQRAIQRGGNDLRGADTHPTQSEISSEIGMPASTYNTLRNQRRTPTLPQAIAIAHLHRLPLGMLPDGDTPLLHCERDGLRWGFARSAAGPREHARRLAADGVLAGDPADAIERRVRKLWEARQQPPPPLDEEAVRAMAAGGLAHGLVEPALSATAREVEDEDLASELGEALERDARWRPRVLHVVRNFSDASFGHDVTAPFLIALRAHRIVADFMSRRTVYRIGLAGGAHCATFVETTGPGSSPFPDPSGDKQLTFVPLTLEPFLDHALPLADAVTGQMARAAGHLLGPRRVQARTFKPFGYVVDGRVGELETSSVVMVRNEYHQLDVAVYGCGDRVHDGWLGQILQHVSLDPTPDPVTDVCLNLLSEEGEPVALRDRREFVGVSLAHIQGLSRRDDRLALLLTSGEAKGLPLTVVNRARCANAIVCDQAAARSALAVLARRRTRPSVA